jgi:putative peptidoglycan lipid II flippase
VTDRRLPLVLSGLTGLRVVASLLVYGLAARGFGLGLELDLFIIAVTPLLATVNLTEAAGVGAAINFYARLQSADAQVRDRRVAGLFVYVGAALVLLGLGFGLAARPVAHLLGGGLPPATIERLVGLLRLSAVGMAVAPLGLIAGVGLLRARNRFLTAAALPFIPVAVQVIALLTVAKTVEGWLISFVIGHALAGVVGLMASARVMRPAWRAPARVAAGAFIREALPLAVAELCLQVLFLRERQLAAALPPGSVSALFLGQRIVGVAGAVVSTGIEHTALPAIATAQFGGAASHARRRSRDAVAFVAVLTVIVGVLVFTWPELWVRLAFHRGAFDELAVTLTATAAVGYVGLYVFNSLGRVAIAANFARGLGWRVAFTNGTLLLAYLSLAVPFARSAGFLGLAIAASVSFCLGTILAMAAGLPLRRPSA